MPKLNGPPALLSAAGIGRKRENKRASTEQPPTASAMTTQRRTVRTTAGYIPAKEDELLLSQTLALTRVVQQAARVPFQPALLI